MIPLVVRPAPQAESLCHALSVAGHQPQACPLLDFAPGRELSRLDPMLTGISVRDYVIAVSVQSVHFTDNALKSRNLSWPAAHYIAVGDATAQALADIGISQVSVPDDPRSEGVIALPELLQANGRQVIILRGDGGRDLIAPTLAARGARVHYCEVYCRRYRPDPDGGLVKGWQKQGVDSIIVTSGGLLDHLFQLAVPHAKDWLLSRLLIVPSDRVAHAAGALGFTQIINAEGASNQALIRALDERKRNDNE